MLLIKFIKEIHLPHSQHRLYNKQLPENMALELQELCKLHKDFIKELDIDGDTVGLITYMRTDGTNISNEAINDFRKSIENNYGKKYLPDNPNTYTGKKAKNAQEAHEAIRPTDIRKA